MNPEDDDLRELLTDAVADVHPAHGLDEIRRRTRRSHPRRRAYAVGGAVLVAASVVTALVVVDTRSPEEPDVAVSPPSSPPSHAAALYFIADSPVGARLYREFQRVPDGSDLGGELAALASQADDPDYTTGWAPGSLRSAEVVGGVIEVQVAEDALRGDELTYQQVVFTAQAALGRSLPVRFVGPDGMSTTPIDRLPELDVLALVSISDPTEGQRVSGSFVARGRASSFEASVPWQLRAGGLDGPVVLSGAAQAEGWIDGLYPWSTEIDVSDLEPGTYTFVASTDDPSGGTEGPGPFSDTRTVVVD